MYSVLAFLLFLFSFVNFTQAGVPSEVFCLLACETTTTYVMFADSPAGFYATVCQDGDALRSLLLCGKYYCTKQEVADGYDYLDKEICQKYSRYNVAPRSIIDGYTMEDIENMPRSTLADVYTTTFNTTVIPDQEYFDIAYGTSSEYYGQISLGWTYSYALLGFWGCVFAISFFFKILTFVTRNHGTSSTDDSEGNSTVAKKSGFWRKYHSVTTYLSTSPTFGPTARCSEPYFFGTVPPIIESLTIFAFVALNVILSFVEYNAFDGNLYWPDKAGQLWRYLSLRTGVFSFINFPLLWAFSSRNNVLLWLTGWQYGTFNNFHNWVAAVSTLEAGVHSVGFTVEYLRDGTAAFYEAWSEVWFWTGGVAMVVMGLMIPLSFHTIRKHWYEIFLLTHIVGALVVLVTCFYHVDILEDEYKPPLWATVAIWAFDRVIRLIRVVLLNGKLFTGSESATAWYSESSETIYLEVPMSLDIKLGPGTNYYVYILHGWKFWESHPFTATSALDISTRGNGSDNDSDTLDDKGVQVTSVAKSDTESTLSIRPNRVCFAIRPYGGVTARIRKLLGDTAPGKRKNIRVLLEGPYGHSSGVKNFDNNLLIIGGSGVTAALSHLEAAALSSKRPAVRMHWSVRHISAFSEYREELAALCRNLDVRLTVHVTREPKDEVDKVKAQENVYEQAGWSVQYGRMSVPSVVDHEVEDSAGSTIVVSCGPVKLMDEARNSVVRLACSQGKDVKYYQETFGW